MNGLDKLSITLRRLYERWCDYHYDYLFISSANSLARELKRMKERFILECIRDMADMEYNKTKDEWWLKLAITIARKEKGENNVFLQKKAS